MAVDNKVPLGNPGVASFASETWGNTNEMLISDTPAMATQTISVAASGADVTIALGQVLAADGSPAAQDGMTAADKACYIAAMSIVVADGATKSVAVYRAGHFDMDALTWAASYDTDAKKKAAFDDAGVSPMILIGKRKHDSDDLYP